jgi:protein-tyrosine kinase
MSLVERAAKRLEELGKAVSQVGGDAANPSSQAAGASSLVERAVRKLEARHAGPDDPVQTAQIDETPASADDDLEPAAPTRREPKLGDTVARAATGAGGRVQARGTTPPASTIAIDLPRLASAGYLTPDEPESAIANEFRRIKRPLIQACHGKLATPVKNPNRIMVTSSVPGEGKSFVALNLALSIAMERDSTVLLVDADTTRTSLSQLLGIQSHAGLMDLLAGDRLKISDALLATNIDRLTVLPAGEKRRHATELLASEAMERLVQHLASDYSDRILLFDSPPLLAAPESAVLAGHMGQIIVVVEARRTTHKALANALSTIQSCPVVATVLNKASNAEPGYSYSAYGPT